MNKPITLCDRCKEYARCCLNYDGNNCRRSRTVEPTNADRIRSMTDEELAKFIEYLTNGCDYLYPKCYASEFCTSGVCRNAWLDWLKEEVET